VRSRTSSILCADRPFPFYFSMQTERYPCRQAGRRFERRPHFLANLLSLRQMTRSPGSFSCHNDVYALSLLLCLFVLAHCLDLPHGDNMTDINQSVLACSCAFNYQSSTPHSPSAMLQLTCHRHLRRSYCRQQAPRPTFCARLTLQQTSSLALPLPARF